MGLRFLSGKSWAQVTRDERFFCLQLYNRIISDTVPRFVELLRRRNGHEIRGEANWELGYEVCFYRDLWHFRGRPDNLFSPKRTFDLALFSDDAIVVVEAKAQQPFDLEQIQVFDRDRDQLRRETGVSKVLLLGVCSSKYAVPEDVSKHFDGPILTWRELAGRFENDPILLRADEVFENRVRDYGRSNEGGYMTGAELVEEHRRGERFFVGRGGGLAGLRSDVADDRWRTRRYETNRKASAPPNRNWFTLDEFVIEVSKGTETKVR